MWYLKFTCDVHILRLNTFGHTRLKLEKRLQAHSYEGNIKTHYLQHHNSTLTRKILKQNTPILTQEKDCRKFDIK